MIMGEQNAPVILGPVVLVILGEVVLVLLALVVVVVVVIVIVHLVCHVNRERTSPVMFIMKLRAINVPLANIKMIWVVLPVMYAQMDIIKVRMPKLPAMRIHIRRVHQGHTNRQPLPCASIANPDITKIKTMLLTVNPVQVGITKVAMAALPALRVHPENIKI